MYKTPVALFGISRPLLAVPAWKEAGLANLPAIAALLGSVVFGAYATGIMPGASATRYWGDAPAEARVLSGILYVAFVALARVVAPNLKRALGFSQLARATDVAPGEIIDIATQAERRVPAQLRVVPMAVVATE